MPSRKPAPTLTAAEIDRTMTTMAQLVLSDDVADRTKLMVMARELVDRGATRHLADWAADVGPDRSAFLYALDATRDQEEGIERLALYAARAARIHGGKEAPDAASVVIASFLSSPEGFDLFRPKKKGEVEAVLPGYIENLLATRLGVNMEEFAKLALNVRTERLADLFGYAYSGMLQDDLDQGLLGADSAVEGRDVLRRSQDAGFDIRIMEDKSARHLDGTTVYNIRVVSNLRLKDEAENKGKRAPEDRARSQFRPDVAFINPRRRQIVVGMAFSGHNAEHQNDQAARYLLPLQELTQRTGSDFFDWTLVPFYIHAGTFVPEDFETTRAGIETSKALQTNNVPMEQRRAMAAFELMSVGMRATSPAQVQAFFQCNPLVGGVSTLEHLRHVEKTINLPKQDAMEQHARFLTRQAELALAACAQICAAENTKGEVQAVVRGVGAFLDNAAKAFGDVSPAFYAEVWEPMLDQVEKICSSVTTNYGSSNQSGHTPIPRDEINNWGDTARRAKALKNRGYDGMKEDHAEHMELIGSQDVLVDTFDIKDVPKADLVEMNSEAKPRGKRGRGR